MKSIGFPGGVAIALVLAFCGSVLFTALTPVFGGGRVLSCVISVLTLAYLLYLLSRSAVRTGRLAVFTLALGVTAGLLYWQPPLILYALLHIGLIWLTRSCFFHNSPTGALADLGFCGLGLAAAVWAAERSGSLFLALWCFFLVQALAIPALRNRFSKRNVDSPDENDTFRRACRSAESALRRLSRV